MENYRVLRAIGRGKYSQVYLARDVRNNKEVVLKILKPTSQNRMSREIVILKYLQGGQNIEKLIEAINNPVKAVYTIVSEYYEFDNFEDYYKKFDL